MYMLEFIPCFCIEKTIKNSLGLGLLTICFIALVRSKQGDFCAACAASLLTSAKYMCQEGAVWFVAVI